ncbi:MAG: protein translocase subunit SecD, partial [Verrucomicrobia bacterium]|nr:protein translocase subunit SecD [Verrucomicrobiota bacterium]
MNKNDRWKFILVLVIIAWALFQVYPPTSRDLIREFARQATGRDARFTNILEKATALQKWGTNSEFAILREAVGTNNIQPYFSGINATNQEDASTYILNQIQQNATGRIKLGLDLQGGTAFLVEMQTNKLAGGTSNQISQAQASAAISQAVEVLRRRVDQFGVAEPVIQPVGANQILIQLPGLSEADKQAAEDQIKKAAYLEFRMVNDRSDEIVANHQPVPPGYTNLMESAPPVNGQPQPPEEIIVSTKPVNNLAGPIVTRAAPGRDDMGRPDIEFTLTSDAAKRFADVTTEYAPDPQTQFKHRMAIVMDGQLYSAPQIEGAIIGGNVQITGNFTETEAQDLAAVLQNPLSAPLNILYTENVDPTLGKDTIRHGIYASVASVIFVSLFMLVYYRVAGLTANVALIVNIIILMGVMCSVGTTLTLPGIAGVVLTIGMAVDANVLIYERLREELEKGKSLRGAIAAGYARAFGTIFDSHVTTLISSIILIFMGTGEIKGFGVTLTIGVAASLFTALVVTRLIFNFLLDRSWLKSLGMLHVIRSAKINFMNVATPLFITTWLLVILSLGYGIFFRGEKLFGVDFLGGDSTTFSFVEREGLDQLRAALAQIGQKDAQIQYQKTVSSAAETLRVTTAHGTADEVVKTLETKFPQADFRPLSRQEVGASVGKDVRNSAILASIFAMFGILVYVAFRYEFSFAVGAIVAVIHDVLLTIGCYCIANGISGRQFGATVVAAVLTIIGFSINDKVVIFDRIREDLKLGMRGSFKEIINQALNQTLSRTIITSGTVFIATACLYIWGG